MKYTAQRSEPNLFCSSNIETFVSARWMTAFESCCYIISERFAWQSEDNYHIQLYNQRFFVHSSENKTGILKNVSLPKTILMHTVIVDLFEQFFHVKAANVGKVRVSIMTFFKVYHNTTLENNKQKKK